MKIINNRKFILLSVIISIVIFLALIYKSVDVSLHYNKNHIAITKDIKSTSIILLDEKSKKDVFLYVLLSTFFFFIIITLIYRLGTIKKDNHELLKTLKEIEKELSDTQRLEIHNVLKQNSQIEVYKFLARAIQEPNMAKDYFLANMSHEIRTPLNGILGFTTILKSTSLNEEQKEFLEIIEESSNNLLKIVNNILDFSTVTTGNFELEEKSFDFIDKIENSVELYSKKASNKNVELGLVIDPSLAVNLIGDSTKISQVLFNLLSNAIKFTEEKGMVNISVYKLYEDTEKTTIRFSVKDTGIGIDKEKQEKIFDAFSQVDISTNRKFGGTGLGLSISKQLVELMGGKINLKSIKGKGSSFSFDLTLKIDTKKRKKEKKSYADTSVGNLVQEKRKYKEIDNNLKTYVESTGARYKEYTENELLKLDEDLFPKILFINSRYIDNKKLNRLLKLPTKVILISCKKEKNITNLIRKPINFTKTLQVFNDVNNSLANNILLYKETKLNAKIYLSILKTIGYEVDMFHSEYKFKKELESKKYQFVLFDDRKSRNKKIIDLILENGAIPFLFSENTKATSTCQVIHSSINAKDLELRLKQARN